MKKTIFIPLLLLAAQSNNILSADFFTQEPPQSTHTAESLYETARKAAESAIVASEMSTDKTLYYHPPKGKKLTSSNKDLNKLLEIYTEKTKDGTHRYNAQVLGLLTERYYPKASIENYHLEAPIIRKVKK